MAAIHLCALLLLLAASSAAHGVRFDNSISAAASAPSSSSASETLLPNDVRMKYHMGPVLSPEMHVYIVWYGRWQQSSKDVIKDFLLSVSSSATPAPRPPSVSQWWQTVRLYTDQTGRNISELLVIGGEHDAGYSHGSTLTRLSVQDVIKTSLHLDTSFNSSRNSSSSSSSRKMLHKSSKNSSLPVNPHRGIYLVLTSEDVQMQDFCRAVCGFHYFTFPSIVGYTLPYAWIGNSGKQCPEVCAFPFALPSYMPSTLPPLTPPNGNIGLDGMVSVIAHELAEMSSNPLINAWYAGEDPTAPTEIADLCEGVYGTGAGGGFTGSVMLDPRTNASFNLNGVSGRKYLVQWVWSPVLNACHGPNAL